MPAKVFSCSNKWRPAYNHYNMKKRMRQQIAGYIISANEKVYTKVKLNSYSLTQLVIIKTKIDLQKEKSTNKKYKASAHTGSGISND